MREYDGVERNYKHSDSDLDKNIERVKNILGYIPSSNGLCFDLSFYSGGIGVLDKLAISCQANHEQWSIVKNKLALHSPESALSTECWAEDFLWLVQAKDEINMRHFASHFVNDNKLEFQQLCSPRSEIYFSYQSDVNNWSVVWGSDLKLNYLYFDQG